MKKKYLDVDPWDRANWDLIPDSSHPGLGREATLPANALVAQKGDSSCPPEIASGFSLQEALFKLQKAKAKLSKSVIAHAQ